MSKPPFNPNQPFAAAKPAFDPNAPFTPMDQPEQKSPDLASTLYHGAIEGAGMTIGGSAGAIMGAPAGPVGSALGATGMAAAMYPPAKRFAEGIDRYRGIAPPPQQNPAQEFGQGLAIEAGGAALRRVGEAVGTMLPVKTMRSLADKAEKSASSRWFKAAGGTLPNAKELGADEALRLGRLARSGGYVTPTNSAEAQAGLIGKGLQESGKKIEQMRTLGDFYGDSPEAMKIVQAIKQDLGPKYGTGIHSGESSDLEKAIQEILKLEPVDKLTATEEMVPRMQSGTIEHGVPSYEADFNKAMPHSEFPPKESYENFRMFQEDPNFVPEYDLHRPTTFNEVAKVATDINRHAASQSKMLLPSGAMTDAANKISELNNEKLLKVLPTDQGADYTQNLQKYSDLSKIGRMNDLKQAWETGGSRNSIVNNISNRIFHRFGHQLSAATMDSIAGILRTTPRIPMGGGATRAALAAFIDKVTTK